MKSIAIPLVGSLIGALLYLAVTAALILKGYKPPAPSTLSKAAKVKESAGISGSPLAEKTADELNGRTPSWKYYNTDVEFLIEYLKQTSNSFRIRQKDLDELGQRLIVVFMCVELMLNAANLAFVTFSRINGDLNGQVVAFFTMVVAACEVVVGLAIIVTIYRSRRSASVDDASLLKR